MLLANLLRTLSEEEVKKIRRDFRLSERACLIFERVAASPSLPPSVERLTKAFGITKENLYRICSEIVDECVRILAPKEEFATLKFLRSKYLYRPFVTELRRVENQLIPKVGREIKERFYEFAFHQQMNFPVSIIDIKLLEEMGKKWHKSKQNPSRDDDLHIKLRVIFMQIGTLPTKKKMTLGQMGKQAQAMLEPLREAARNSQNPLALYYYYQTEWYACIFNRDHVSTRVKFLYNSLEVVRKNPGWFQANWEAVVELQIANELASDGKKAKESLEIFRKHYHGQTSETSRGAIFLSRFMNIAFLAQDLKTSREILNQFENNSAIKIIPSIFMMALLARAKLELAEGNLVAATKAIEHARYSNKESYFLAYELPIRGLETIVAFKCGDFVVADQLVGRNIKWLRSRRISLGTSAWIYFYQMIQSIIHLRMTGESIRPLLLKHFTNDFRAEYPDFFLLLESDLP